MSEYKQALVLRGDLDLSPGKAVAQGAHVSVKATDTASRESVEQWKPDMAKITLKVDDLEHLEELYREAESRSLPVDSIVDQGRTEIQSGTKTAIAIGPAPGKEVDSVTGNLSLY